jgi:hypothetical protein
MPDETASPNPTPTLTPSPSPPPVLTISVDDYQRFRGLEKQLADIRVEQQLVIDAKEKERLVALAGQGKAEQALDEQRKSWESKVAESNTKYGELERQVYDREKTRVLDSALVGRTFVGESPERQSTKAGQLRRLLESEYETTRLADGNLIVRHKATGRPAEDVLKESLASPDYEHFFKATSQGGAGGDATRSNVNPTQSANPHRPGSVEFYAWQMKAQSSQYPSFGLGIPRKSSPTS